MTAAGLDGGERFEVLFCHAEELLKVWIAVVGFSA